MKTPSWFPLLLAFWITPAISRAATIEVQVDKPGHAISPNLWGLFFEDINCSADGGIYAELVRNRSLEDSDQPEHWSLATTGAGKGRISVAPEAGEPSAKQNRHSLKLEITEAAPGDSVGAENDGYWGMSVREGAKYDLSLSARAGDGFSGPITVTLQGAGGKVYATETIPSLDGQWQKHHFTLTSSATDPAAKLVLSANHAGTVWFDTVSLFPQDTWKNRPGGLRPDLMNMLDGIKPSFIRFPGGCWVEGDSMKEAYRWKETVGDPAARRTQWNLWKYWATHGLGFHEYLQMCEDLGAEPLFVINCGMAHKDSIPMSEIEPFIQDALDAIEYCNGPISSTYGAMRAKNGHPTPFNLKFMEIGNENGGPKYFERWAAFYKAIKAGHPDMNLIANEWAGGHPRNVPPQLVDEHYYDSPEFFMSKADLYDSYDRKGPKIYIGEYAVTRGSGQGNLRAAIGEAAFMTGVERNSDIVAMASYAPLFANVNYKKWNPDLICFDSSRAYGLPSYYAQKLFSLNRGDHVLPIKVTSSKYRIGSGAGGVGVGTWRTRAEYKDIKVTRDGKTLFDSAGIQNTDGWKQLGDGKWTVKDGAIIQSSDAENVRAVVGDKTWKNYTLSLKARKTSGNEGFLILFNVQNEDSKAWWNIGGWDNTRHAIEMGGINSHDVTGSIEAGRWYDVRIETSDDGIKCYLDGQLIHDATYPEISSLYASASRDDKNGDVIVKVVNAAPEPMETDLRLNGANGLANSARATVLTSPNPNDENSLIEPEKVLPMTREIPVSNSAIHHNFPGNSLTIIRIKANRI